MGNPQNGTSSSNGTNGEQSNGRTSEEIIRTQKIAAAWNQQLSDAAYLPSFHGDALIGDKIRPSGFFANLRNRVEDVRRIVTFDNLPALGVVLSKMAAGGGLDMKSGAKLIGSMANDSNARAAFTGAQVKKKYDRMLHPPLTYLGDAFKYRTADGKFNSALNPHLGQAGAPYAKTVPCKTHPLGALPDAGDIFDCLMAREEGGRESKSGLSSMLIYHATIIIHDIFRTNDKDKNISDTSSYLDLSPLYGFTEEMVRKVRDDKYKLGLLKPDTFAEDRLLRQPPGVCIMLVMYNRYHNYAATQLRRINENDRFSVPDAYKLPKLAAAAKYFASKEQLQDPAFKQQLTTYAKIWREHEAKWDELGSEYDQAAAPLQAVIDGLPDEKKGQLQSFYDEWEKAWDKLDDDLFNTARLITCGQFIQVSIHDYLRALMGFHQFNTDFTLDPRLNVGPMGEELSRGIGNQVTVEFNLLYRFHCAISLKDERYAEDFMRQSFGKLQPPGWDPKTMGLQQFMGMMKKMAGYGKDKQKTEPWDQEFGLPETPELNFKRNPITGLFDDQQMINELTKAMDDPISNFGPRNVPKCMKPIEILGILQARKWGIGTLNDFRDFFGMKRHTTFESITKNKDVQDALRDLYEHPDKVELYPGVFCESDANMGADPGPSDVDSALWAAIFSDAITLVRSDRFYTVDWNTESLTSWGMKEVTPDHDNLKSSVFHRLLQRAFPEWFPYDSVRFFHPFYTSAQNAKFAQEQGYGETFKMDVVPGPTNFWGTPKSYTFKTEGSNPNRPQKPMHLKDRASIKALLADGSDKLIHPSRLPSALKDMPPLIAEVLKPGQQRTCVTQLNDVSDANTIMMDYFTGLVRDVVKREFIVVDKHAPVYQIDVTRDLAIPVITRYVADFLGFGHLVRSDKNPGAAHSENEIYKHITNCQVFLSYNADETKLLKRRHDFKTSMAFLLDLTRRGSMREACKWSLTRVLGGLFGKKRSPMSALGFRVAQQILKNEKDEGRAAAILLLIGLDGAYNAVLAFTSVLDQLLEELYGFASGSKSADFCPLLKLQQTAFDDSPAALDTLSKTVLKEQRKSVRLPVIRKAVDTCDIKNEAGDVLFTVEKGQTVICDIHAAEEEPTTSADEADYLSYTTSFSSDYSAYHPKHIAALSVAALIKVLAQMRNLRRGVDRQGVLKKINLASSSEGYSNFMAPMRMMAIEAEVEKQLKEAKAQSPPNKERVRELEDLFTTQVLKPATDTYLTPEWDEMVPFPTTWKVRFDGFGWSDYGGADFPMLREVELPDDVPPFYQPQGGSSRYGGSFAGCMCPGTGTHDGGSKATVNGDAKTNAVTNGHTNGYTNGHTNGHTNGYSSSLKAGSTTSVYAVSAGCGLPDHVHV